MTNTIKLKRSNISGSVPTTVNLADGEVAVNTEDQKIYARDGSSIIEIANASTIKLANFTALGNYSGKATAVDITAKGIAGRLYRRGSAADNGVTVFKDALSRSWERDGVVEINPRWAGIGESFAEDTEAWQKVIDVASSSGLPINASGVKSLLRPTADAVWEGGIFKTALFLRSNLTIYAETEAVLKIADGVSSDAAPLHHQMFFTNEQLSLMTIRGVTLDMNGQNNKISPNRASKDFNRFMNAQICVSGTPGGNAAKIDFCDIESNTFKNNNGVSCIVAGQSNTVGAVIGMRWRIRGNTFRNVGLDTDDHSSIYGRCTKSEISGNHMTNDVPFDYINLMGGRCAIETHASGNLIADNIIENYQQGFWVTGNFTEEAVRDVVIRGNRVKVVDTGLDFWSKNHLPYGEPECPIQQVSVYGNTFEILNVPTLAAVRSFIKFGARQQPSLVDFSNNVCRSYAPQDTALALFIVGTDQRAIADQIKISNNTCAGLSNGIVAYFSGDATSTVTRNIGRVTYENNDPGYLTSSTVGLTVTDVYLYGPSRGIIESLRVSGLQHPSAPIATDKHVNGRARVYGNAVLPIQVTWDGFTLGNGSLSSKVSINTDSGAANVSALLGFGSTSAAATAVFPRFTGITADSSASAAVSHSKAGSASMVMANVDIGASWLSLLSSSGGQWGGGELVSGSTVSVSATVPCRYADI